MNDDARAFVHTSYNFKFCLQSIALPYMYICLDVPNELKFRK